LDLHLSESNQTFGQLINIVPVSRLTDSNSHNYHADEYEYITVWEFFFVNFVGRSVATDLDAIVAG
jgi:hypothetical protein